MLSRRQSLLENYLKPLSRIRNYATALAIRSASEPKKAAPPHPAPCKEFRQYCREDHALRRRIRPKPTNALPSKARLAGSGTVETGVISEISKCRNVV